MNVNGDHSISPDVHARKESIGSHRAKSIVNNKESPALLKKETDTTKNSLNNLKNSMNSRSESIGRHRITSDASALPKIPGEPSTVLAAANANVLHPDTTPALPPPPPRLTPEDIIKFGKPEADSWNTEEFTDFSIDINQDLQNVEAKGSSNISNANQSQSEHSITKNKQLSLDKFIVELSKISLVDNQKVSLIIGGCSIEKQGNDYKLFYNNRSILINNKTKADELPDIISKPLIDKFIENMPVNKVTEILNSDTENKTIVAELKEKMGDSDKIEFGASKQFVVEKQLIGGKSIFHIKMNGEEKPTLFMISENGGISTRSVTHRNIIQAFREEFGSPQKDSAVPESNLPVSTVSQQKHQGTPKTRLDKPPQIDDQKIQKRANAQRSKSISADRPTVKSMMHAVRKRAASVGIGNAKINSKGAVNQITLSNKLELGNLTIEIYPKNADIFASGAETIVIPTNRDMRGETAGGVAGMAYKILPPEDQKKWDSYSDAYKFKPLDKTEEKIWKKMEVQNEEMKSIYIRNRFAKRAQVGEPINIELENPLNNGTKIFCCTAAPDCRPLNITEKGVVGGDSSDSIEKMKAAYLNPIKSQIERYEKLNEKLKKEGKAVSEPIVIAFPGMGAGIFENDVAKYWPEVLEELNQEIGKSSLKVTLKLYPRENFDNFNDTTVKFKEKLLEQQVSSKAIPEKPSEPPPPIPNK